MKIIKVKSDMSPVDITLINKFKNICLGILSVAVLSLTIAFTTVKNEREIIKLSHRDTVYVQEVDIQLNDSEILNELVKQKCILPNVALAQMKIETGNFKSSICKENKNIAGIKTSKSKYVAGMNRNHCSYKSYRDCIKDYVRIQNRYLKNIDGKYATSNNYIETLKQLK